MSKRNWIELLTCILVAIFLLILVNMFITSMRTDECQQAGYAGVDAWANTVFCVQIREGNLYGVPLSVVNEEKGQ